VFPLVHKDPTSNQILDPVEETEISESSHNFKDENVIVDHVQYEQAVESGKIIEVISI
jgi:hypothetical protein